MSQVASLSVGVGADLGAFKAGMAQFDTTLKQAQASAEAFATSVNKTADFGQVAQSATRGLQQSTQQAKTFLSNLSRDFEQGMTEARTSMLKGLLSPAEYERVGRLNTKAYNAAIQQELRTLDKAGLLTTETQQALINAYRQAGQRAGLAMGSGITQGAEEATAGVARMNREVSASSFVFESMDRVGHRAMGNLVMGMTMLSTSADGSASAITKVGHAIEIAGFVLGGPEFGIPIAAGVQLIEQITSAFERSKKAAEDAAAAFQKAVDDMGRQSDQAGLQAKARSILEGDAIHGLAALGSTAAMPAFKGGLLDLRARVEHDKELLNTPGLGVTNYHRINDDLARLLPELDEKEKQLAAVMARLQNPVTQDHPIGGLPAVHISAPGSGGAIGGLDDAAITKVLEGARALVEDVNRNVPSIDVPVKYLWAFQFNGEQELERAAKTAMDAALKSVPQDLAKDTFLKSFDAMVTQTEFHRNTAAILGAGKGQILTPEQKADLAEAQKQVKAIQDAAKIGLIPDSVSAQIIERIAAGLQKVGIQLDTNGKKASGLAADLHTVGDALQAMGNLASSLGNSQLAGILNGGSGLANNLSNIAANGLSVASGIGALTAGLSIVTSIFGQEGELTKEHNQILQRNNDRLAELSLRIAGFQTNADNTAQVARFAAAAVAAGDSGHVLDSFGLVGGQSGQLKLLQPILDQFHLTLAQVAQVAKDNGIGLLDSKGHVIGSALDSLAQALTEAAKAAFTFQNNLNDIKSYNDLRDALAGKTSPTDQLARDVATFNQTAINQTTGQAPLALQNFDATTAVGQQAIRAYFQNLLEQVHNKSIDPSQFGGFQNLNELMSAIGSVASDLNSLGDAANKVTEALTNVPSGFKVALDRFIASAPAPIPGTDTVGPMFPTPTPLPQPMGSPTLVPVAASGGTAQPTVTNVNIEQVLLQDVKDAADLFHQLGQIAQQSGARGGVTRFTLATGNG